MNSLVQGPFSSTSFPLTSGWVWWVQSMFSREMSNQFLMNWTVTELTPITDLFKRSLACSYNSSEGTLFMPGEEMIMILHTIYLEFSTFINVIFQQTEHHSSDNLITFKSACLKKQITWTITKMLDKGWRNNEKYWVPPTARKLFYYLIDQGRRRDKIIFSWWVGPPKFFSSFMSACLNRQISQTL